MSRSTGTTQTESKTALAMIAIWGSWLMVVLILTLLRSLSPDSVSLLSELALLIHAVVALAIIGNCFSRAAATLLALSMLLRVGLVFWDLHFQNVMLLPGSGADSEMYYFWAVRVAEDPSLIGQDFQGGAFSKMYGLLFSLIGPARAFAQYTNALFGLCVVMIVYRILTDIRLPGVRIPTATLALVALLPNSLVLSAVFLRESVIAFLIAISLFCFIKWFLQGPAIPLYLSVVCVLIASVFHSGVIGIIIGYLVAVLFRRRTSHLLSLSFRDAVPLAVITLVAVALVIQYPDVFLGKFGAFTTQDDLLTATNRRLGNSAYLQNLVIKDYGDLLLYGPLRAFYFVGSPLPWDWRGLVDALTFLLDSVFYIATILLAARKLSRESSLPLALVVVLGISLLIFGAGVSNAGTALRHRYKLFPIFALLWGLVFESGKASLAMRSKATPPLAGKSRVVGNVAGRRRAPSTARQSGAPSIIQDSARRHVAAHPTLEER